MEPSSNSFSHIEGQLLKSKGAYCDSCLVKIYSKSNEELAAAKTSELGQFHFTGAFMRGESFSIHVYKKSDDKKLIGTVEIHDLLTKKLGLIVTQKVESNPNKISCLTILSISGSFGEEDLTDSGSESNR